MGVVAYFMLHRMGMKGELSERLVALEGVYHPFDGRVETATVFRRVSSAKADIVRNSPPCLFPICLLERARQSPAFKLMRGTRESGGFFPRFRAHFYEIDCRISRFPRDTSREPIVLC